MTIEDADQIAALKAMTAELKAVTKPAGMVATTITDKMLALDERLTRIGGLTTGTGSSLPRFDAIETNVMTLVCRIDYLEQRLHQAEAVLGQVLLGGIKP